jgi:hypothetical protein
MNSDAKCNTPGGLSLLDFPFLGAAFAAEGGGEGKKIRCFLGEPERPKVLHFDAFSKGRRHPSKMTAERCKFSLRDNLGSEISSREQDSCIAHAPHEACFFLQARVALGALSHANCASVKITVRTNSRGNEASQYSTEFLFERLCLGESVDDV